MAARPLPAPAAAKKKPVKAPPVPPHKRQQPGHSAAAPTTTNTFKVQFEPEGEYESIDTHLIQEQISDVQQNATRETAFGQVQTSTAAHVHVQEQSAGQFQQGPRPPVSYAMMKPKPYQREVGEAEIREAAPSLEPASIIMVSVDFLLNFWMIMGASINAFYYSNGDILFSYV